MKKFLRIPEFYLAVVLLAFIGVAVFSEPEVRNIRLLVKGFEREASFPISEEISTRHLFHVNFDVESVRFPAYSLHIVPDDCLEGLTVNGVRVSLDSVENRCDYTKGVILDSGILPRAENGKLNVSMALRNTGGPGGVSAEVYSSGFGWRLFQTAFILEFFVLLFFVLRRFRMPVGLSLLILLATLAHVVYTEVTPYTARSHDVWGHVEYVESIADNHRIPADDACWSCYHPPVYYTLMAPVWSAAEMFGFPPTRALQWASLCFSFVMVAVGIGALRLLMSGSALWISSILWAFWPVLFLVAPRVGNDQLFFVAHVVCFCASLGYVVKKKAWCLILGAAACWIAFWTKSTGSVSICIWLLGFLLGYFPREKFLPKISEWAGLGVMAALGVSIVLKILLGENLVGNASGLNGALRVGSDPVNFLYFDIPGYLSSLYANAWSDEGGRQYFWNYLMKTSLFGEFQIRTDAFGKWTASIINYSFFGLLIFAAVGFWKKKFNKAILLLFFQALLFVLALAVLRFKYPYSCSNDFRYIVPVLLSFVPFVGWGICKEGASVKWKVAGILCVAFFVGATCLLYLSL